MSHKLRFAVSALLWAVFFYLLIWLAATNGAGWMPYNSGYMPPTLAVMLAAQGVSWKRKLVWVAGTLGAFVLIDAVAAITGIEQIWASSNATAYATATLAQTAAGAIYHTFSLVYPLAALALFVGRRPSVLWETRVASPTTTGSRQS